MIYLVKIKNPIDMNAKEEIKRYVQREINDYTLALYRYIEGCDSHNMILKKINHLENLITTTEQAIFELPSEEVCMEEARTWGLCLGASMNMRNFILNYKKTEPDES